jgi:hypothetical protein
VSARKGRMMGATSEELCMRADASKRLDTSYQGSTEGVIAPPTGSCGYTYYGRLFACVHLGMHVFIVHTR